MAERIEVEMGNDEFLAMLNNAREDLGAKDQPLAAWVTAEPQQSGWEKAADYFIDKMVPEVGNALMHEWNLGRDEMAKFLFGHTDGQVMYGSNQQPLTLESPQSDFDSMMYEASLRQAPEKQVEMER